MKRTRAVLAVACGAALGSMGVGAVSGPVRANATCADVWVNRQSSTPTYLTGPGFCQETGLSATLVESSHDEDTTGVVPPGAPDGFGVSITVAAPPPP
jgi:hypothetical protein